MFIPFYKRGDSHNRTKTIGLVIVLENDTVTKCYLEIVFTAEREERIIPFYPSVGRKLKMQQLAARRYIKDYPMDNVLDNLSSFLSIDKPIIDQAIKEYGIEEFFQIDEIGFRKMLQNVLLRRGDLQIDQVLPEKPKKKDKEERIPFNRNFGISDNTEPAIGVEKLAKSVAEVITNLRETDKGNMVGVFGQWGRGKSFLIRELWNHLSQQQNFIKVDYHVWKYQDTPASWAYLYEAFADKYYSYNLKSKNKIISTIQSGWRKFKLNLRRIGGWPFFQWLLILILSSAGIVFGFILENDWTEKTFLLISSSLVLSGILKSAWKSMSLQKTEALKLFAKYYGKHSYENVLGLQSEIQRELKKLLKAWLRKNERILLVVDDIDRCYEDKIISVIDALRVMLEDEEISKKVIIVAAIDERVLKGAILWKYKDLLKEQNIINDGSVTQEYMDKLFICGIKLAHLNTSERDEIFQAFTKGKVETSIRPTAPSALEEEDDIEDGGDIDPKETILTETSNTFELNQREYNQFRNFLKECESATPRQIRIIYYRYLLARNIYQGILKDKENQLLMQLLFSFQKGGIDSLRKAKSEVEAFSDKNIPITILGAREAHEKQTLVDLLNVLETVIAY